MEDPEEKVLASLLASGSGVSDYEIVRLIGWKSSDPEEHQMMLDSVDDILSTFKKQGLVTTSRSKGVDLAYSASIPQTTIDYQSAIPGLRGDFEIGLAQVGLSQSEEKRYTPSEEFYLGKN